MALSSGRVSGFRLRGGIELEMEWKDGRVTCASVSSAVTQPILVRCNGKSFTVVLEAGSKQAIVRGNEGEYACETAPSELPADTEASSGEVVVS